MWWLVLGMVTAEARPSKPCWVPNRLSYTGRSSLVYTPPEEARLREAEVARLERRQPRDVFAGWLALEVDRLTLAAADPGQQPIVVLRDGVETVRFEPESDIPEPNPEVIGFWYSYAVVQLPEGLAPPFSVEVTDRLLAVKCTWSVDAAGAVVLEDRKGEEPDAEPAAAEPAAAEPAAAEPVAAPREP